jgi:hypothetical protein
LPHGGRTEENERDVSETRQPSDRAVEPAIEAVSRSKTARRFSISIDLPRAFATTQGTGRGRQWTHASLLPNMPNDHVVEEDAT